MRSAIGIDIGGTKIRAARVSEAGDMRAHAVQSTANSSGAVVAQIDGLIAGMDAADAAAIGIGVPGRVDSAAGIVYSGGFVDLSGEAMALRLHNTGGRPVFIDNDASMALVAEARVGAAKGLANAVMLTIGTGIGGALMERGRIVHGRATAGQLGHISIDVNGLPCVCGRKGCLETTSSGTALGRLMAAAGLAPSTSAKELLRRDDAVARSILEDWVRPLRAGIDSLVAAFDPDLIILGGGLGAAACEALWHFPALSPWYQCPVKPAQLGDHAGVIGAALAALEHAT